MATGQVLLDTMELLNQELQLQSGESDVTRGLVALNRAQDFYEAVAARYPDVHGGNTTTVVTVASTETSTYPAGYIRLDGMQGLSGGLPDWPLDPTYKTGGHAWNRYWPYNLLTTTASGKPRSWWTNGTNIYWDPLPDSAYTIRVYGFAAATDITAGGTFLYPDICILPFSAFAVKLFKLGLDDPIGEMNSIADQSFKPVVEALTNFQRVTGRPFQYSVPHTT